MASIPLPALSIKPPQAQNPLETIGSLMQLKSMQQNQELQRQQLANEKLQGQKQQMDIAQTQAVNDAYHGALTKDAQGNVTVDTGKLSQALADNGHGSAVPGILKNVQEYQKSAADLQEAKNKLTVQAQDSLGYLGSAIRDAKYDPNLADMMIERGLRNPNASPQEIQQLQQMRATIAQNPAMLKGVVDNFIAQSPKQQEFANQEKVAQIRAATPDRAAMQDWLSRPENAGKGPVDYENFKRQQQAETEIKKETDPRVIQAKVFLDTQRARAEQAVKNGSSEDAGKMLAQGLIAPSEIAARSNPSFLVFANKAAMKYDPNYNAQKAEADFKVASSPANVAFFGSANSLTNKGGTLDQLEAAAKAIPNGQIPSFNKVEDWEKAATGSGPVAKYASVALGVADDYSKVMGGGQGSDASRGQALKLIGASLSPDQRQQAVEGIRGSVGSQIDARIGNNKVLRNMYGQEQGGGGMIIMKAPNGQTKQVKPEEVEHYKSMGATVVQQ